MCGKDPLTGQNFDHRKAWLVERIKQLSAQFAVDICAYAVMSNHYHLVLHVNQEEATSWSDEQVIKRWTKLFPRNGALVETLLKNSSSKAAQKQLSLKVSLWRERLMDISWFMRCLNETVARNANREDKCSGRFWEGRFKSQALLDEKALVTCMAYVDLNPIRAGLANSLETSDFTSIQERLINQAKRVRNKSSRQQRLLTRRAAEHLVSPQSNSKQPRLLELENAKTAAPNSTLITTSSYLGLLDITVKALSLGYTKQAEAKRLLDTYQKPFTKLGINTESWISTVREFHKYYSVAAGSSAALLQYHQTRIRAGVAYKHPNKWVRGIKASKVLYGT